MKRIFRENLKWEEHVILIAASSPNISQGHWALEQQLQIRSHNPATASGSQTLDVQTPIVFFLKLF